MDDPRPDHRGRTWPRPYLLAVAPNLALMAYIAEFPPLTHVADEKLGPISGLDAAAWPAYAAAMGASAVLALVAFRAADRIPDERRRRTARLVGTGVPVLVFLIGVVNILSGLSGGT